MQIPETVIQTLKELPAPTIVAISGFGGSGKSTAASILSELLHAPIICIDPFGEGRGIEDFSNWEGMDFKRFEQEVLIPFSEGINPLSYHSWRHEEKVPHGGLLIVEGVGLFRPELLKYFSYKIWVDAPQDIALERGKKRDADRRNNQPDDAWDSKWDGPWKRNDTEYFETHKPKEQADLIIENS